MLNSFHIWVLKPNLKLEKTEVSVGFGFFGSVFGFWFGFAHPELLRKEILVEEDGKAAANKEEALSRKKDGDCGGQ